MAIPKKGSRVISVDGKQYRWLIRRKATYTQSDYGIGKLHVAVEGVDSPLCTLVIYTDRKHPKDGIVSNVIPVIPSDIEVWIKQALELGWKPGEKGIQFLVTVLDGLLEKVDKSFER